MVSQRMKSTGRSHASGNGRAKAGGARADATAVFAGRLARLAKLAADAGAPQFLVTNPIDVGYLTGFLGGDSYLFVGGPGKPVVVSDFRYQEELEHVRSLCEIVIRKGAMSEAIGALIASAQAATLGVQAEHLTLAMRDVFAKKLKGVKLVETAGLVMKLRIKKDELEVSLIRSAIKIQEAAFEATVPAIERALRKNGWISEQEIAAHLEFEMKVRGSSKPGFETIIGAGPNGSLPHYRPGPFKLRPNKPLLVDWGAMFKGYHGDMTRVLNFGKWSPKIAEIYKVVLEAQEQSAAAIAPGMTTAQIDGIARKIIADAGYGEFFGHGLGHGLGLDGHEEPRVSHMAEGVMLEPGHVITIEPGIYLAGVGGVRIEDDYLVTETGSKNLCSLPKSFEWASR